MIRAVKAINYLGRSLLMRLDGREVDSLLLWNIDGISPGSADINVTEVASSDGAYFNSARQNSREITLTLLLNWAPTIELARKDSYSYFPLKRPIRLIFYSDPDMSLGKYGASCARYIDGYVQENTVEIFGSKNCAAQITVKCPDPHFYACSPDTDSQVSVSYEKRIFGEGGSAFSFPYSNESLDENLTYFGEESPVTNSLLVNYPYDAIPTGMDIVLRFKQDLLKNGTLGVYGYFKLTQVETGKSVQVNLASITKYPDYSTGYLAGDALVITTIRGKKDVTISRPSIANGEGVSVLGIMEDPASDWLEFQPGSNTFTVSTSLGLDPVAQGIYSVEVQYTPAYEGV